MLQRLGQASSFAGVGLIAQGLADLVATRGTSAAGWASLLAGIAAVIRPEAGEAAR